MKPLLNFKSSTFLAANNISKADANSAAENSFKTKQHLKGSNLSNLFFGIKNIPLIIFFLILTISHSKSKDCLDFLPFGHNDNYVQLPEESEFCIKYGNQNLIFKTDKKGGRFFIKPNKKTIQVFGDSQILGIDIQNQKDHFLSKSYSEDLIIYAAPNNGPYQVLNFIIINQEKIKKKIIIGFNLSVDMFRLSPNYNIQNYVSIKEDQLDDIMKNPYKYRFNILKNLITNKFFTISRKNQKDMQKLFEQKKITDLKKNLNLYFDNLFEIKNKLNLDIDFIITMPYWIYDEDKKLEKFKINNNLENKLKYIICDNSFKNLKLENFYISILKDENQILTLDKRHIKSEKLTLTKLNNYCKT